MEGSVATEATGKYPLWNNHINNQSKKDNSNLERGHSFGLGVKAGLDWLVAELKNNKKKKKS
jgi:hypothetical protein